MNHLIEASGASQQGVTMSSREIAESRTAGLTPERLRELMSYCPNTGVFLSLKRRGKIAPGDRVGTIRKGNGYLQICIDRKLYYAHRLAFLHMTGSFPAMHVDHINGDPLDNRFSNLREASRSVNSQNMRRPMRHNTSGPLGVTKANQKNGFVAKISADGKTIHLGTYKTAADAHQAYLSAKRALHEGCTI